MVRQEEDFHWAPLAPGEWSSVRCPALAVLKLRPFLVAWGPALSLVSTSGSRWLRIELFCPDGSLAFSGKDEWILLGSWAMSQATGGSGADLNPHQGRMISPGGRLLWKLIPRKTPSLKPCRGNGGPGSKGFLQPNTVKLLTETWCTDSETGGKLSLGPLALTELLLVRCPAIGAWNLRPFLEPWSLALSLVSTSGSRWIHPRVGGTLSWVNDENLILS
ncbi:hypothetical protein AAY473_011468 [Plecturocebus cupreus]